MGIRHDGERAIQAGTGMLILVVLLPTQHFLDHGRWKRAIDMYLGRCVMAGSILLVSCVRHIEAEIRGFSEH